MNHESLITKNTFLVEYLSTQKNSFAPVVRMSLDAPSATKLDFSSSQKLLADLDIRDTLQLSNFVTHQLENAGACVGLGGYLEDRHWYARSGVFSHGEEVRSIHLGVDIWLPANNTIFAPCSGRIHSFQDNAAFGDYGPTIILEHDSPRGNFFTLYGHLSRDSLNDLTVGESVLTGQQLGVIGAPPSNGDWPPHLHFQIILDMGGMWGDFPGVAARSRLDEYSLNCPNPNLILGSTVLEGGFSL